MFHQCSIGFYEASERDLALMVDI